MVLHRTRAGATFGISANERSPRTMRRFVVSKNNREETAEAMSVSAARVGPVRSPTATCQRQGID